MTTLTKLATLSALLVSLIALSSAQSVELESGFVAPAEVAPGEDISGQQFNVVVHDLSADGNTDYLFFEFPEQFADRLSPNNVDSNVSISSSKKLVDYDGDDVKETVQVGLSEDGEGSVTANVTLDTEVNYPQQFENFRVEVHVEDSSNGQSSNILQVTNAEQNQDSTEDNSGGITGSTDTGEPSNNETSDDSNSESESGFISSIVSFLQGLF